MIEASQRLALVVNTRNEEALLPRVIASVDGIDEIIVADMASTDNTVAVATSLGARVVHLPNAGFCEPGRMPAIAAATSEWVLVLDADERLVEEGLNSIRSLLAQTPPEVAAYRIPRLNYLGTRVIRGSGWGIPAELQSRLFRRTAVDWPNKIHSHPTFHGTVLDLDGEGSIRIEHDNFEDLGHMLEKLNRYTGIEATQLLESGQKPSLAMALRFGLEELVNRYDPENDGPMSLVLSLAMFSYRINIQAKAAETAGWPGDVVVQKDSLTAAVNSMWSVLRQREMAHAASRVDDEDDKSALDSLRSALHLWSEMPPTLSNRTVVARASDVVGPWAELLADETGRVTRLLERTVAAKVESHAYRRAHDDAEVRRANAAAEAESTKHLFDELAPRAEAALLRVLELELQVADLQDLVESLESRPPVAAQTFEFTMRSARKGVSQLVRRARSGRRGQPE